MRPIVHEGRVSIEAVLFAILSFFGIGYYLGINNTPLPPWLGQWVLQDYDHKNDNNYEELSNKNGYSIVPGSEETGLSIPIGANLETFLSCLESGTALVEDRDFYVKEISSVVRYIVPTSLKINTVENKYSECKDKFKSG